MKIRMVVLTKSSKYGKNCVAGINLYNGKWIRLVTDEEESHGAVSDDDLICQDGTMVQMLDVIDVPISGMCNDSIQPENVLLDLNTCIEIIGKMTLNEVLKIHPTELKTNILGNEYAYITETRVDTIGYSLILVEADDFVIVQEENPSGKPKTKANFYYRDVKYENMSVTDSRFYSVKNGTKFEKTVLVVSIGTPFNNKYYKFVSAIYVL